MHAIQNAIIQLLNRISSKYSVRNKIIISFVAIILGMSALNAFAIFQVYTFNKQYDTVVSKITGANQLITYIKRINKDAWPISIGMLEPSDSQSDRWFSEAFEQVHELKQMVDDNGEMVMDDAGIQYFYTSGDRLDSINRSLGNLQGKMGTLKQMVKNNERSEDRTPYVDAINDISALAIEYLYDYTSLESDEAERINVSINEQVRVIFIVDLVAMLLFGLFSLAALFIINRSISVPIKQLVETTKQIGAGDFSTRMDVDDNNEITELNKNFNIMVKRLQALTDDIRISSDNLRYVELQLLQEQINPHFLYNTLETIIWMAEKGDHQTVITLVQKLSEFFRLSLSGGKNMIPLEEEVKHAESYLAIQQYRYEDIMDYKVDISEDIKSVYVPKIILQPIVENALYHGLKNKRGKGTITIYGRLVDTDTLKLVVSDTGMGMKHEPLEHLRSTMYRGSFNTKDNHGYALANLQQRIKLRYGNEYGIHVDSVYGEGTKVTLYLKAEVDLPIEIKKQ